MTVRGWVLFLSLGWSACGGSEEASHNGGGEAAAERDRDAFLDLLPPDDALTVRVPSPQQLEGKEAAYKAFLQAFGAGEDPKMAFYGSSDGAGIAREQNPGFVLTQNGGWARLLPQGDKAALSEALRTQVAAGASYRPEGDWVLLTRAGVPTEKRSGPALPTGALAFRLHHHALLHVLAGDGDVLDGAFALEGRSAQFQGRLVPHPKSRTGDILQRTGKESSGLLESLPAGLALRMETTLPATFLAEPILRRVASACEFGEKTSLTPAVRFLREALSAVRPGVALGIDVNDGQVSVVLMGRIADTAPSGILSRLREGESQRFGPLVVESSEPEGKLLPLSIYFRDAVPHEELAECVTGFMGALCDPDEGLPAVYGSDGESFVIGIGSRARVLAAAGLRRLEGTGRRDQSAWTLHGLRQEREGGDTYVFGVIANSEALSGLPEGDRTRLKALLGLPAAAKGIKRLVLAGWSRAAGIDLEGLLVY